MTMSAYYAERGLCNGRGPSLCMSAVCTSACLSHRSPAVAACSRFAAERVVAGDQSIAARRRPAGAGTQQQMPVYRRVDHRRGRLNTDLLKLHYATVVFKFHIGCTNRQTQITLLPVNFR